jgi:hypothetical protein
MDSEGYEGGTKFTKKGVKKDTQITSKKIENAKLKPFSVVPTKRETRTNHAVRPETE